MMSSLDSKVARRFMYHFQRYSQAVSNSFKERPVISNSMLCIGLYTAGDICAQYVEQKYQVHEDDDNENDKTNDESKNMTSNQSSSNFTSMNWDYERTGRISSYGACVTGPLLAVWYPFLERLTKRNNIARFGTLAVPCAKVFMDEIVLEPPFLLVFFGYMNIAEGGNMQTYKQKISNEYIPTYTTSLMGWPIVLLINFRYVPVFAQSAVVNICCVVWNGFLSYRNAKSSAITQNATNNNNKAIMATTATVEGDDVAIDDDSMQEQQQMQSTHGATTTTTTVAATSPPQWYSNTAREE